METGEFRALDFKALQEYELRKRMQPVLSALEGIRPSLTSLDRLVGISSLRKMSHVLRSLGRLFPPGIHGIFGDFLYTNSGS